MNLHHVRAPVVALAAFLLGACEQPAAQPGSPSSAPDHAAPLAVQVATVTESTFPRTQSLPGTVRPIDRAVLSARVMGTVARADFALGQHVRAGELLVVLDAAEISARVTQAEAALAQISADYAREHALLAKGASPAETVRSLADRRDAAEAALRESRALLSYTRVTAPFEGTVARRLVNPGDLATPGTPLLELSGSSGLRVEVEVPASLPAPDLGSAIAGELGGLPFTGSLAEISDSADPLTRTRLAKINLPPALPARAGDYARVAWPAGDTTALLVPATAVSLFGQMERVFVLRDGHAQLRLVKTSGPGRDPAFLRVAAGLNVDETIILAPASTLRDGQPITPQP